MEFNGCISCFDESSFTYSRGLRLQTVLFSSIAVRTPEHTTRKRLDSTHRFNKNLVEVRLRFLPPIGKKKSFAFINLEKNSFLLVLNIFSISCGTSICMLLFTEVIVSKNTCIPSTCTSTSVEFPSSRPCPTTFTRMKSISSTRASGTEYSLKKSRAVIEKSVAILGSIRLVRSFKNIDETVVCCVSFFVTAESRVVMFAGRVSEMLDCGFPFSMSVV
mmetsp:Transcript_7300/g.17799  ORF Transcript_7300/g.17799 Transcript_7300/m.17799 type:complete len:218 (-) Transcript_7300:595-1248(-)